MPRPPPRVRVAPAPRRPSAAVVQRREAAAAAAALLARVELSPQFNDRMAYFVGAEGNNELMLFNVFEFREHLNDFFKSGETTLADNPRYVHWVFYQTHSPTGKKLDNMKYYCSVDNQHQDGSIDMHCTIYSLYYEVYCSKYRKKFLNGEKLEKISTTLTKYRNLRVLYNMLERLMRDKDFISYCYTFGAPTWQKAQRADYLRRPISYANLAKLNANELSRKIKILEEN